MNSNASGSKNIDQIQLTAVEMGEIVSEVVFLGGCVAGLLVDQVARTSARATEDVDVIVDIANLSTYYKFGERLKQKGFQQKAADDEGPICRWYKHVNGGRLMLDVMPTDQNILGFSNPWYPMAVLKNEPLELPNGTVINVIRPLTFLATKFAAWNSRGAGDIYHKDIEDVVYILENRPQIVTDYLDEMDQGLRSYLKAELSSLLQNANFIDRLSGMVSSYGSEDHVVNTMRLIAR